MIAIRCHVVHEVLEFNEAIRIYLENLETDAEKLKVTFQNQMCNEKSVNTSLEFLFSTILDELNVMEESPGGISFSEIKSLMSSDFDRNLLDLAVSSGKSSSELHHITTATTKEIIKKS